MRAFQRRDLLSRATSFRRDITPPTFPEIAQLGPPLDDREPFIDCPKRVLADLLQQLLDSPAISRGARQGFELCRNKRDGVNRVHRLDLPSRDYIAQARFSWLA